MKDASTFGPGDVCFGKVRGFPAWPARVVALAEESSVKQCKYHVSFFGTGESGLLKADEMFSYFANKTKLTKNVKRKGFQKGLEELEQYILENNLTPAEGELDSTPAEIPLTDVDTPGSDKPKTIKVPQKRPALKRLSEPIEKRPRISLEPTPTSRSGRKIRPKKFSDEYVENDESLLQADASDEEPSHKETAAAEEADNPEEVGNVPSSTVSPAGDADVAPSETAPVPTNNKSRASKVDKAREEELKERRKGKLMLVKWFRIEKRILELDISIRANLGLKNHSANKAMMALDELGTMILDPLMLKKHPQIVETVKKLRSYVGNSANWNLTEEEELTFPQLTEQIRNKAEFVYNRMRSLFVVPQNASFWKVFSEHVDEFTERTKDWEREAMYQLTHDPTGLETGVAHVKKTKPITKIPEPTNGTTVPQEESPPNAEEPMAEDV